MTSLRSGEFEFGITPLSNILPDQFSVTVALHTCKGKVKTYSELSADGGFCFQASGQYDPEAARKSFK